MMFWLVAALLAALSGYLYGSGEKGTALLFFLSAAGASYVSAEIQAKGKVEELRERMKDLLLEIHSRETENEKLRERLLWLDEERSRLRQEVEKLRDKLGRTSREAEIEYIFDSALEADAQAEEAG